MVANPSACFLLVSAWLAMAGAACTNNEDVGAGEVSFDLPPVGFSVISGPSESRWRAMPPTGIPNVLCRGVAALTDDCCHPPALAGSPEPTESVNCQQYPLSCDNAGWCALVFEYSDSITIDLSRLPALKSRRGWVLANADLAVLNCKVDLRAGLPPNSPNLPSFPIESAALYVAPQGVLSPRAPSSRFLMDIPLEADSSVALDAEARSVLASFLVDFNTPFTLILNARVAIEAKHSKSDNKAWSNETVASATFAIDGRVRASF